MSWQHFECPKRHYLTVMVNQVNHNTQSIKLSEIFRFYHKIFTIYIDRLFSLTSLFYQNFLMLSSEES